MPFGQSATDPESGPEAAQRLAQMLREMQRASGRSLRSLARDVHVSHSSLSRYLRGEIVPAWGVVKRTCEVTGGDLLQARELWRDAADDRSRLAATDASPADASPADASPADASPDPGEPSLATTQSSGYSRGLAGIWRRLSPRGISPLAAAIGGVAVGLAVGLLIGLNVGGSGPNPAAPASEVTPGQTAPTGGRYCPWKYMVTDSNPDDIRVFDSPQHDSIIARYVPDEVFYAPDPPHIVNGYLKTEQGWIAMGNWIQRYHGPSSTCHVGER